MTTGLARLPSPLPPQLVLPPTHVVAAVPQLPTQAVAAAPQPALVQGVVEHVLQGTATTVNQLVPTGHSVRSLLRPLAPVVRLTLAPAVLTSTLVMVGGEGVPAGGLPVVGEAKG